MNKSPHAKFWVDLKLDFRRLYELLLLIDQHVPTLAINKCKNPWPLEASFNRSEVNAYVLIFVVVFFSFAVYFSFLIGVCLSCPRHLRAPWLLYIGQSKMRS